MVELIDEIGKNHCAAIRYMAEPFPIGDTRVRAAVYALPYRSESLKVWETPLPPHHTHMAYDVHEGTLRLFLIMSSVVWGQLRAHGLVEQVHGEFAEVTEPGRDMHGNRIERKVPAPQIQLTARGEDFYSRKWLFKALSKFTAKTNKRIAIWVPVTTAVLSVVFDYFLMPLIEL